MLPRGHGEHGSDNLAEDQGLGARTPRPYGAGAIATIALNSFSKRLVVAAPNTGSSFSAKTESIACQSSAVRRARASGMILVSSRVIWARSKVRYCRAASRKPEYVEL